ncbi:MAG: GNAT family N-acetyltransferase [Alphaproteobacteria bacterium]|nr:GNAT family N-acetyltransferase [Alphaproteobacteria bacterium]
MIASAASARPVPRDGTEADVPAIQAIYAHHVRHGLASFEEIEPSADELAQRRRAIVEKGLPYLAIDVDGKLAGYAYAGPFRPRSAYRFSVEDSIYVAPGLDGRGLGRQLLASLIERSTAWGARQMVAVIGDSANAASIGLHARLGFRMVGSFRSIGFKLGRWVDSVMMQRELGDGDTSRPPEGR